MRSAAVGHADGVEQFGGAPAARAAVDLRQRAEEVERLPAGEVAREAVIFRQIADAGERRLVPDRLAEHRPLGVRRPHDGHHDLDQRALARAVGPEQAEDLAATDVHLDRRAGRGRGRDRSSATLERSMARSSC